MSEIEEIKKMGFEIGTHIRAYSSHGIKKDSKAVNALMGLKELFVTGLSRVEERLKQLIDKGDA